MTDQEIIEAIDAGKVPLAHLCLTREGRWEWYDVQPQGASSWRLAKDLRDAIERVHRKD